MLWNKKSSCWDIFNCFNSQIHAGYLFFYLVIMPL